MGKEIKAILLILFLPTIMVGFIGVFLVTGVIASVGGEDTDEGSTSMDVDFEFANLSELVLAYEPLVREYAEAEGIPEYVPILLAIMMQESGGNGSDPMQISEAHCGSIGCVTNPQQSIEYGVKRFKELIELADGNLLVALQAYNYGTNFINWIKDKGGEYTLDLATQYSREIYEREKAKGRGDMYKCNIGNSATFGSCYGDYLYVQHVMRYVGASSSVVGSGVWGNPLPFMRVTSGYRTSERPNHNGIDYSCNRQHIPVYAVDDGVVEESLYGVRGQGFGGYGNIVLIKHNDSLYSLYAHLQDRYVVKGQTVQKGQAIGTCGGSGDSGMNSYTIHLHLEARTKKFGGYVSPAKFFSY